MTKITDTKLARIYKGEVIKPLQIIAPKILSRTQRGLCKNLDCPNSKQTGSARCKPCSERWDRQVTQQEQK